MPITASVMSTNTSIGPSLLLESSEYMTVRRSSVNKELLVVFDAVFVFDAEKSCKLRD
jgi:hypothetical protein